MQLSAILPAMDYVEYTRLDPSEPVPKNRAGFEAICAEMGMHWRWNIRAKRIEYIVRSVNVPDPRTPWPSPDVSTWGRFSPIEYIHGDDGLPAWYGNQGVMPDLPTAYRWWPLSDRISSRFLDWASDTFKMRVGNGQGKFILKPWKLSAREFEIILNSHLVRWEEDPFKLWLGGLPDWDGVDRVEGLLKSLWPELDDAPLTRWASRATVSTAVLRAFEPGAKADTIPVIFGPQGCGKSTYCRYLLPQGEYEADWFGDALELGSSLKEQSESLAGRVIVETAELAGFRKADIERLKAFLTRQDDGQHRAAYARSPEPSPRRCAIIGTGNESVGLPNDPSGNRRFVAVSVKENRVSFVRSYLDENRIQLWAEAVAKYKSGLWRDVSVPAELRVVQEAQNEEFRDRDEALENSIIANVTPSSDGLSLNAIAQDLNLVLPLSKSDSFRLAAALRGLGWTRDNNLVTRQGKRVRLWRPPDNWESAAVQPSVPTERLSTRYADQTWSAAVAINPEKDF